MLDATSELIQFPTIQMSRYGTIPDEFGGGPKYRIIWAPSRWITLYGAEGPLRVQMYFGPQALEPLGRPPYYEGANVWIIERWKAPWEFDTADADEWNADPAKLMLGPYPARGSYVRAETLQGDWFGEDVTNVICLLERGQSRRAIDNALFIQQQSEREAMERSSKREAIMRSAMRPFGAESFTAYGGSRNSKTYPIIKSREEAGLPAGGVTKALKLRKPPVYEIMTS